MRASYFQRWILLFVLASALMAGCAHTPQYALPGPSPMGSHQPSPTPLPSGSRSPSCGAPLTGTTAFVVMSVTATSATPSPYGLINSYVLANSDGTFGDVAQVINLRRSDIVQFANADNFGPTPIFHSAVGFLSATTFPAFPFTFPASTQTAIGSTISSAQWSTGRVAPTCYSQQFSLTPGTYYFGDFDYYNLSNMRDVIIVSTSSQRRTESSPLSVLFSH